MPHDEAKMAIETPSRHGMRPKWPLRRYPAAGREGQSTVDPAASDAFLTVPDDFVVTTADAFVATDDEEQI